MKMPVYMKKAGRLARLWGKSSRKVHSDVLGSYTGVPADGGTPVQDADDL